MMFADCVEKKRPKILATFTPSTCSKGEHDAKAYLTELAGRPLYSAVWLTTAEQLQGYYGFLHTINIYNLQNKGWSIPYNLFSVILLPLDIRYKQ